VGRGRESRKEASVTIQELYAELGRVFSAAYNLGVFEEDDIENLIRELGNIILAVDEGDYGPEGNEIAATARELQNRIEQEEI